jgi:hypothetical protein
MPLTYHYGQIEVQTQANTLPVAEMLAGWVGPVGEFCRTADLVVLAIAATDGRLEFMALSGAPPVAEIVGPSRVLLPLGGEATQANIDGEISCGGLAIGLAVARRARLNGALWRSPEGLVMEASEAFTNCRKYIAPSAPLADERHFGPVSRQAVDRADPWVTALLANAETSFLASVSPDGVIDVSHRGGPPGFLRLDAETVVWEEYVGDGMFKSAGNIRATGTMALLVPDLATGDALELTGHAEVQVRRRDKQPRMDALLQNKHEHPVQGLVTCTVGEAFRLERFMQPRKRLEKRLRVTSASATEQQYPQ